MKRLTKSKKCKCSAHSSAECVCGAWDNAERSVERITEAVDAACTCGGKEPGKCCPACDVWHKLFGKGGQA